MGTVFAHNVMRQADAIFPNLITNDNLLNMARAATIPFTLAASIIAINVAQTGYLLIVAFDVVLATVVTPLFGCFYTKNPRPNAALASIVVGAAVRIILELALEKDGFLLLPYKKDEFLDYGEAASANLPTFFDAPKNITWIPEEEVCEQSRFQDYTGVDSLAAFVASIITFVLVQTSEQNGPMFELPGVTGYHKNVIQHDEPKSAAGEDETNHDKASDEVEDSAEA